MEKSDFQKKIEVLSQKSSREILRILGDETKTVKEVFEEIQSSSSSLKYRESVYKALERLTEVDLVEKIEKENSVKYRAKYSTIKADFLEGELELEGDDSK